MENVERREPCGLSLSILHSPFSILDSVSNSREPRLTAAREQPPYRCFLPDLTRFGSVHCTGPGLTAIAFGEMENGECRMESVKRTSLRAPFTFSILHSTFSIRSTFSNQNGGESGIRTHGRFNPTHAFQACALSHSAISPEKNAEWRMQNGECENRALFTFDILHSTFSIRSIWRREGDSNPRYRYRYNGFRDRRVQPLCHLSASRSRARRDANF